MTPYRLTNRLDGALPLMLASPHSGTHLPAAFLAGSRLDPAQLRRLEDSHVGAMLAEAAALGVPLIEATHSRAVIDLNRAEDEIDPTMIEGVVPRPARLTERVRRGYGLIPRIAAANQPIHKRRVPAETVEARLEALHRPWHQAIARGLEAARARHGYAVLLDVHSMPPLDGPAPAQLVLGDLHGRSAAPALVDWLHARAEAAGLRVARNMPYAGGHTTERHGAPLNGLHAVQLELDRSLYMDLGSLSPHAGFPPLSRLVGGLVADLVNALPSLGLGLPLAAE